MAPVCSVPPQFRKISVLVNNNVSSVFALLGVIIGMVVVMLSGCASPTDRVVVRASLLDADNLTGADAQSTPIVSLENGDPLIAAGLRVGDEVLVVRHGFESLTVTSVGTLELAYQQIESAINNCDPYIGILVRRDAAIWALRVTVEPGTLTHCNI